MGRLSFAEAFAPGIRGAANLLSQGILDKAEKERKKSEELKAKQEQQGILSQLMKGRKKIDSLSMGDMTQEDKFNLYSKLTPANQNAYEYWQKQNAPPKKEYMQFGDNLYEKDANGNLVETPVLTKDKEPKSNWVMDENWGDKVKKLKGYENPDADPKDETTRIKDGKKYTITDWTSADKWEKKTNPTNSKESYYDLSSESKKMLGEYFKKQQEYRSITQAGFGNRNVNGKENEPTYREKLDNHNKVYLEAVRNVMPESAKNWYNKLYNAGGGDIDPRDYLLNLKNSFAKGTLGADPEGMDNYDVADFNVLIEQFKPIYGFDPREQYGQFLEKLQ